MFFESTEVSYLGFRLTPAGIKPSSGNGKNPLNKGGNQVLCRALLCNFFRTHIKDFARICEPLNKATRKDAEYTKGPITGKALDGFNILKTMLCTEPIMAYPRSDGT